MRRFSLAVLFVVVPVVAHPQGAPRLEPLPMPPALAKLDFALEINTRDLLYTRCGVVLFDAGENQLVCIDPASGIERRAGREGEGPGEFRTARGLAALANGSVLVSDFENRRLTRVTPDWKIGMSTRVGMQITELHRPTGDSVLTLGGATGRDLVAVSLHDGGSSTRFAPTASDSTGVFHTEYHDLTGCYLVPRRRGGWYVGSPWKYRILIVDEHGIKQATLSRDLPDEMPSDREVADFKRQMLKLNPQISAEVLARFVTERAKQPDMAIAAPPVEDDQGRLWVPTSRVRKDSTEVDVFDARQRFLGTVRMPGHVDALAARSDELVALVDYAGGDRDGFQGVLRYRIR
ncbi:MAG: hypothetical protein ACREL5_02915 [Gemmatimonadales bacterium]